MIVRTRLVWENKHKTRLVWEWSLNRRVSNCSKASSPIRFIYARVSLTF